MARLLCLKGSISCWATIATFRWTARYWGLYWFRRPYWQAAADLRFRGAIRGRAGAVGAVVPVAVTA